MWLPGAKANLTGLRRWGSGGAGWVRGGPERTPLGQGEQQGQERGQTSILEVMGEVRIRLQEPGERGGG